MKHVGVSMDSMIKNSRYLREVQKSGVYPGDLVIITTRNSVYRLLALGNGQYRVSGGWFDKTGISHSVVTITGCSWGGSAIKVNSLAACGLSVEFGNGVITSTIRKIVVLRKFVVN
jgi:hypothetical protein